MASSKPSRSNTFVMNPALSNSSQSRRPERMSALLAREEPILSGNVTLDPPSGAKPKLANGVSRYISDVAKIKSPKATKAAVMPMTGPLSAMNSGCR